MKVGPNYIGEYNHNSRLSSDDVRAIRRRKKNGEGVRELARFFKVSHVSILRILQGKTYAHVTDE